MTWPARVVRNGETISGRVSALIDAAAGAADVPFNLIVVVQGSWDDGSKSAGTHRGGGAFDLRTWNLTAKQRNDIMFELRRRGVAAWLRGYADGTNFDPHLHGIVCDESGLSPEARQQCIDYSHGLDGLARKGPDPYPRPKVVLSFPMTEPKDDDMPLSTAEITAIAKAVHERSVQAGGQVEEMGDAVGDTHAFTRRTEQKVDDLAVKVNHILAALKESAPPTP